jgi:hypothetical protein
VCADQPDPLFGGLFFSPEYRKTRRAKKEMEAFPFL